MIVTGGAITVFGSILVALIGWSTNRQASEGNYAKALVEASAAFSERLDTRNDKLEAKVDRLEQHIDTLDAKISTLTELVVHAIPVVESAGHVTQAEAMRAAVRGGQP